MGKLMFCVNSFACQFSFLFEVLIKKKERKRMKLIAVKNGESGQSLIQRSYFGHNA
jgi:hypothetical protein